MQVISRSEAKALGLKRFFTGKPCKRGHIAERYVFNHCCVACSHVANMTPEQVDKKRAKDRVENMTPEQMERKRETTRAWQMANPEKDRAIQASRKARKLQATPAWADREAIAAVYAEADRLTRETGIPHHVDHIVPLQSPVVSGLHVHWNLRPLPAPDNFKKGNRYWEGI